MSPIRCEHCGAVVDHPEACGVVESLLDIPEDHEGEDAVVIRELEAEKRSRNAT